MTAVPGRRGRVRRGGYLSRRDAVVARDALLDHVDGPTVEAWTVARWLRYWLTTRTSIRPSTLRSYTEHVQRHLIPHLGRIPLGELTGRQIADMITALAHAETRYGRPLTPSTLPRIRATLRSALNAAIRDGLLRDNPARHVEVPSPRRPQAQVWTDADDGRQQQTGPTPGQMFSDDARDGSKHDPGDDAHEDLLADRAAPQTGDYIFSRRYPVKSTGNPLGRANPPPLQLARES